MTTYADLINKGGTIYNKNTGVGYSSPDMLAKDMGLSVMPENWHLNPAITQNDAWQYQPASAVTSQPVAPVVGAVQPKPFSYAAPPAPTKPAAPIEPVVVKNYVRNPAGMDVYDKAGNYISAEKAATIPGFWDQVEITDQAPNTSKGAGLGGPVSGLNDGLGYITYNGIDVYEKATGKYIDFETAKKLDIWNKIETSFDPVKLEALGIDPNAVPESIKDPVLQAEYEATVNPYQAIYNDYKTRVEKLNTELEGLWLEYNLAVVDIEENPWLLTGEATQELAKLKKQKMAKINALTSTKDAMTSEFNALLGIEKAANSWDQQQLENSRYQSPEEQSAQTMSEYEQKLQLEQKYAAPGEPIEQWSDPYYLGGDLVQRSNTTGEIRTAVNVPAGSGSGGGADTVKNSTQFTKTQINNGAAAAGMSISDFENLTVDQANEYINGAKSGMEGGRLATKDLETVKDNIKSAIDGGQATAWEAHTQVFEDKTIPAADRMVLLQWIEKNWKIKF